MWYRPGAMIRFAVLEDGGHVYKAHLNIEMSPKVLSILSQLNANGSKALAVGGSVRDAIKGENPKDIDIEVYNIDYDSLSALLKQHGRVDLVGKKFGIIKFTEPGTGDTYDFSIPRRDNKIGIGHRGFKTTFDPTITPKDAAARRDFTVNALAYDPLEGVVHDYFGGVQDLNNGVLRATSEAFAEDPLRVLRGMQFAARFDMKLDPETAKMCQRMITDYQELRPQMIEHYLNGGRDEMMQEYLLERDERIAEVCAKDGISLEDAQKRIPNEVNKKFPVDPEKMFAKDIHKSMSIERINEEWMKLATKGKYPGNGLEFLKDSGWLQFYPDLAAMQNVPQDPEWHPEGWEYQKLDDASHSSGSLTVIVSVPKQYFDLFVKSPSNKPINIADPALRYLRTTMGVGYGSTLPSLISIEDDGDNKLLYISLTGSIVEEYRQKGISGTIEVKAGDVWTHVKHVMNSAADIAQREGLSGDRHAVLVLSAMCHDLAKPPTTALLDKGGMLRWTSHGHEAAGGPYAKSILESMGIKRDIIDQVVPLVVNHLKHAQYDSGKNGVAGARKMAHLIHPADIDMLGMLMEADYSGRPPIPPAMPKEAQKMVDDARAANIHQGLPKKSDLLTGQQFIEMSGLQPGPHVGKAQQAYWDDWLKGDTNVVGWTKRYLTRAHPKVTADMVRAHYPGVPDGPHIGKAMEASRSMQYNGYSGDYDAWLRQFVAQNPLPTPAPPKPTPEEL